MYKYSSFQIVFSSCIDEFTEDQRKADFSVTADRWKASTVACRLATHVYLRALFSLLPSEMGLEMSVLMPECIFQKKFFLMKTSVFL